MTGAAQEPLLRYEIRTRRPTRRGNLRVVVGENGAVRFQRNEAEPSGEEGWAADLPAEPVATVKDADGRLGRILRSGGFFEMDELQVEEAATDGTVRVLSWNGEGGPRTVTIDRASPADFDRLIANLARLLHVPGM
jgi:hypothetical protein